MAGDNSLGPIIRPVYDPSQGFPKMVADARGASEQIKRQFDSDFAEIGRLAGQALAIPRNQGGSLNLGADQYREAAKNSQAYATALREISNAAALAAKSTGDTSAATGRFVAASRAAATTAEAQAREANQTATAYERLQIEIDKTKSATDRMVAGAGAGTTANHLLVNSAGSLRIATLQAGQQIQDIGISLYSGQRAAVVFAQQLPQLAFALSYLEGSANKTHDRIGRFATFLSGPFGIFVGIGVGVLATLVAGLFKTEEASDKAGSATDQLKNKLNLSKNSYETLIAVVNEYNKAQEKSEALTYGAIAAAEQLAQANLKVAKAMQATYLAQVQLGPTGPNGQGQLAASVVSSRLDDKIKQLETDLREATRAGSNFRVEQRLDPEKRIRDNADLELTRLVERNKQKLISDKAYEDERFRIKKKAEDDIEAYRKAKRDADKVGRTTSRLPDVTGTDVARLLGTSINPGGGKRSVAQNRAAGGAENSYHLAGTAIDIPLTVNGRPLTKEAIRAALEPAGVVIKELLGPGDKGHADHFHIAFAKARRGADEVAEASGRIDAELARAVEQAQRLAEFGREAGVSIIAMNDRFTDTPQAVLQSRAALEQINDLIGQLNDKQPTGFKDMVASLEAMMPAAEALRDGPFTDMLKQAEEQARVQDLLIQGRIVEAEVLDRQLALERQQGPLSAKQLADVRAMVVAQQSQSRELEKQNALRQQQVDLINATQDNIRQTTLELLKGDGLGAIGNLFKRQFDLILEDMATSITDNLFGEFFRNRKEEVVNKANEKQASAADKVTTALGQLTAAANGAAGALGAVPGVPGVPGAANDNPAAQKFGEIVVTANRSTGQLIKSALNNGLKSILGPELFDRLGSIFKNVMQGAAYGQVGGGLVGKNNIGSALGGVAGKLIGDAIGKKVGGLLGSALGPIGGILGGALGGLLGGLFKKKTSGYSVITQNGISGGGSSADLATQTGSLGGNVQASLARIADQLGGTIGAYNVAIGARSSGYIKVSASGNAAATTGKKVTSDIIYNGKDPEAAARVALLNAIQDGAIQGIREGSKRLLQAGKDVEAAVKKALDFESVFTRLRQYKDPVGAALDTLNKEFTRLKTLFGEAGASAAEYAQLEELYGIERAKAIKTASAAISGSLKSLLDDLLIGDNGLSLRDRKAGARAAYDPLAARVAAGDVTAFDDYAAAAKALLDIERQISGSQSGYFDLFGQVRGLTQSALDAQSATAATSASGASPFTAATAPANDNVVGAIGNLGGSLLDGLGLRLDAINANLGALILQGQSGGSYSTLIARAIRYY